MIVGVTSIFAKPFCFCDSLTFLFRYFFSQVEKIVSLTSLNSQKSFSVNPLFSYSSSRARICCSLRTECCFTIACGEKRCCSIVFQYVKEQIYFLRTFISIRNSSGLYGYWQTIRDILCGIQKEKT